MLTAFERPPTRRTKTAMLVAFSTATKLAARNCSLPKPAFVPPTNCATKLRGKPSTSVNPPPMVITPLGTGCNANAATKLFGPVPKLIVGSSRPAVVRRAMRVRLSPLIVVKSPATTMFVAVSMATARTALSAPVVRKLPSTAPLESRRAMRFRFVVPPTLVKSPTSTTLPPGSSATPRTRPLAPASGLLGSMKVVSKVPLLFKRATRRWVSES